MASSAISTQIFVNEIPEFVEDEIQRLYGHIRSSLPYLRIFKSTEQVSTYVAKQEATPTAIFLFRESGRSISVLNELIHIEQEDLQRFAACIFQHFPAASILRFNSIKSNIPDFLYPVQRGPTEENVVITLPATPQDYMASLGKKTRPRIKQQLAKLEKDFPSFKFQTYEKDGIDEQVFSELINLKGDRIKTKKRQFSIDEDQARRLMALAKHCGVMHVIWIDGQIAAGKIDFRLGTDQIGEVTVHDPSYNSYSLGMICNFLDISESITKGIKKFHLGAGQNPYKLQLLGIPQQFQQLNVYRSSRHMMRNLDWATKIWIGSRVFHLKTWLNDRHSSPITRSMLVLFRFRHTLREAWARRGK